MVSMVRTPFDVALILSLLAKNSSEGVVQPFAVPSAVPGRKAIVWCTPVYWPYPIYLVRGDSGRHSGA